MSEQSVVMRKVKPYSKWCFVPMCTSTSISTPNKLFVSVPLDSIIRSTWLISSRRDKKSWPTLTTSLFCCQDHFNLEEDMENYVRFKIMKGKVRVRMKDGVVPHIFDCQTRSVHASPANAKNLTSHRKERKMYSVSNDEEDKLPNAEREEGEKVEEMVNVCDYLALETNDDEGNCERSAEFDSESTWKGYQKDDTPIEVKRERLPVSEVDPLSSDRPSSDWASVVVDNPPTSPVGRALPLRQFTIKDEPDRDITVKEEPLFLSSTVEESLQEFQQIKEECKPCVENEANSSRDVPVLESVTSVEWQHANGFVETDYVVRDPEYIGLVHNPTGEVNDLTRREVEGGNLNYVGEEALEGVFGTFQRCVDFCETECAGDNQSDGREEGVSGDPEDSEKCVEWQNRLQGTEYNRFSGAPEDFEYEKENMDVNVAGVQPSDETTANNSLVSVGQPNKPAGIFPFESFNGDDNFEDNNGGNQEERETLVYKMEEADGDYAVVESAGEMGEGFTSETQVSDVDLMVVDHPDQVDEPFAYEIHNVGGDFLVMNPSDQVNDTFTYVIENGDPDFEEVHHSNQIEETFMFETRNDDVNFVGVDKHDQANEIMACEMERGDNNVDDVRELGNKEEGDVYPVALWKYIPLEQTESLHDESSMDNDDNNEAEMIYDLDSSQDSESLDENSADCPTRRADGRQRKQTLIPRLEHEVIFLQDDTLRKHHIFENTQELLSPTADKDIPVGDDLHLQDNSKVVSLLLSPQKKPRVEGCGWLVDDIKFVVCNADGLRRNERFHAYADELSTEDKRRNEHFHAEQVRRNERFLIENHRRATPMIKPSSGPTTCGTCGKKLRRKQCFHVA